MLALQRQLPFEHTPCGSKLVRRAESHLDIVVKLVRHFNVQFFLAGLFFHYIIEMAFECAARTLVKAELVPDPGFVGSAGGGCPAYAGVKIDAGGVP